MSGKLTTPQEIVLRALDRYTGEGRSPVTGPEISEVTRNLREWATPRLKQLARMGLAEPMGVAASGARCYQITDAGRQALQEQDK